ncbi:16S rRNA (adenine(1518)-N(6)/adenine(1519)-N(6))-dimethyltransferase RsmA [Chromatocurvus halotolerans]|uniref:Ribosomal RNA small subunit methyltransferase A n=1 Tax=Chromatocurvus halotolerans TaxID=1132028 RepID=A0A4R2KRX6_9GAMM|nr:16S rRNA (adenine(1518)-N(6)/adenine(1519)-N(6))-dimethyltransferase RsmA [Chromatocurvus halotolerans]TCO73739.1 dimethyladenosine transferase [Chromatocurvus halotolerans]
MRAARPRKRFGQNFLEDGAIVSRIESAVAPRTDDRVVEIGPGRGALTEALVSSGCYLDAIELDRDLTAGLLAAFSIYPRFKLHSADALEFDYAALLNDGRNGERDERLRVVGNLPYNISTPLIFRLLENTAIIEDMHFMLQLEVVKRLAAQPGGGDWGRLGIMAQYHCYVEHLFDVPPSAFNPPPKVQSAIVRLTPWRHSPYPAVDVETLRSTVQAAFAQRRKTLRNNLKGIATDAQLKDLDIDPGARAETLQLTDFIAIANQLHD